MMSYVSLDEVSNVSLSSSIRSFPVLMPYTYVGAAAMLDPYINLEVAHRPVNAC